jgi:hypothetical protein
MSCFSFYLFSFFSYKIRKQEAEQALPRGKGWHKWEWEGVGARG